MGLYTIRGLPLDAVSVGRHTHTERGEEAVKRHSVRVFLCVSHLTRDPLMCIPITDNFSASMLTSGGHQKGGQL